MSVFLTQPNIPTGNPAFVGNLTGWTNAVSNLSAEVIYKVDIEAGRAVFFKTQSLSVSLEGAVGPGIVFRGEYSNAIDYIYSVSNGRRDAVLWDKDGDNYPETYYIAKQNNGPASTVVAPTGDGSSADYWEEMGTEELFVAAKIAIFEESFVKNTINVGQPATAYAVNPQITIYGGDSEPYISVGQGTQGYGQQGIFIGVTEDGGPNGTAGTSGLLSIEDDTGDSYLRWDGYNLEVKSDNVLIETTNLTIDSSNELISIGSTGYDANGIWLGRDAGASKLSLKNGTTSYLKWDGTGLGVKSDDVLIETTNLTIDSQNELISIGQGTNGYVQTGVFVGMDGGNAKLSLKSTPAGGTYNSLEWDGSTLTIRGAVRQTAAGVVEGSLRGAWSSGVEYYPNDIVSANGQSWVMIGAVHTSTANDEPGVGVNYTTYWSVAAAAGSSGTAGSGGTSGANGSNGTSGANGTSGTNGAPGGSGAGIVYRGRWEEGTIYYKTTNRTDVVKGADDEYYLAKSTHTAAAGQDPTGGSGITGTPATYWESFGATFTSVATDILFADDVYADRTVNIGSEGGSAVIALNADYPTNTNPRIQIGQDIDAGDGFLDDGIYFGYAGGNPVLSIVNGSTFLYYQSGSIELSDASFVGSGSIIEGSAIKVGRNLAVSPTASNAYNFTVSTEGVVSASQAYIEGTIAASAGNIGNWIIDPIVNGEGGNLRDEDSEIIFDPNTPEIQIYSDDGTGLQKKVWLGSSATLSATTAVAETVTWSSAPTFSSTNKTSNDEDTNSAYIDIYTSNSTSTPFQVYAGLTAFGDISWPTMTVSSADIAACNQPSYNYPNYSPSYAGQIHGGFNYLNQTRGLVGAALYLEVVDTNNSDAVIGSALLGSAFAYGYRDDIYGYQATDGGYFVSVTGDTEITLSDGSIKLAKDILKTDTILAWDELNNKFSEATITNVKSREVDRIFEVTAGGLSVKVSDTHGFWIDGGDEIKVKDIIVGETHIYIKDGDSLKFVVVDDVDEIIENTEVYSLSVPPYVNYISNGIISHNAIGGGLVWSEAVIVEGAPATNGTLTGLSGQTKNITLSTTTSGAALRYRLRIYAGSTETNSVNQSGVTTSTITTNTNNFAMSSGGGTDTYFGGSLDSSITSDRSNNFVEIQGGGVQVVSNNDRFVRMTRRALADANPELFRVQDGTAYFVARTPNSTPYPIAIDVEGDIAPNFNAGGAIYDLGTSTASTKWKNLNGIDISGLAVSLTTSITTDTSPGANVVSNYDSYVVLPGGAIIQWGSISDATNPKTVVFPLTFPTSVSSVVCSTVRSSGGSDGTNHVYNIRRSRCDLVLDGSSGFWIAIGH